MLDYIIIIISLIWLVFAIIYDFKTREVPDWLSYSFIAIAISINLIYSLIIKDFSILLLSLIGFFVFGAIGMLLYYLKQWGGGDAKLLMGVGAMFANYPLSLINIFNPNLDISFLAILFVNIMFFGAIYGIVYIIMLAIINRNKIKKLSINDSKYKFYILIAIILMVLTIFIKETNLRLLMIILIILALIIPKLIILVNIVEKNCMYKSILISKLTEGDWIKDSIKIKGKLIYNNKSLGIKKEQIEQLKKYKLKHVTVKYGVPFAVSFLLGLAISLIFGNILIPI